MRKGELRKRTVSNRQKIVAALIGIAAMLVVFGFVALSITPVKYDVKVGMAAPATITATREVTDEVSTQQAIEEAMEAVADVPMIDDDVTESVEQSIAGFFDSAIGLMDDLKDIYIAAQTEASGVDITKPVLSESYEPSEIVWEDVLSEEQLNDIKTALGDVNMSDSVVYTFAAQGEADIMNIKEDIRDIVSASLKNGIMQDYLQTEKGNIERQIEVLYPDGDLAAFACLPVDQYLAANMLYDAAATQEARTEAAAAVDPIIYMQYQTVVVEGETVTEAQMAVLQELGLVDGGETDYLLYVGMFLFIALLFCVYAVYLFQFESEILAETRKLFILATICVVIVAIAVPLSRLDTRIIPVFFGTMLACVLVSQRSALALGVFLAFIVGAVCSWDTGLLSDTMLRTLMMTIIGGSVSVFALYRPAHRASLIYAGLLAGGVNVVMVVLMSLIAASAMDELLIDSAYALGSGLLAGVLAIGTLPIWEAIFRVSTPAKLLELSNPNHPLLKRLTIEAPGTYHHSILTANLAEAGADAVGANALLCRVGAYYHDVGKLKNPQYFKENQKDENLHDIIDPRESAKIITSHLTDGLELAQKHKLPRDVQKIMAQHHGDTVVPYFFHKAQEAGMDPVAADFQYQGTKPTTKESAVVMLADCVEAAVRSIDDPDKEQVREMINKLIRDKYNDGQLDDCPLGRRDLNTLAKAFLSAFDGAFHERVKYPGQQ
ncbi:MAG: HDIG domain-containing protein [Eubacteriales bacterium]|nr:HDIG domain-containing protein [Eubacteriales bacterium]